MRFNPANEGMEPNIGGMVARISRIKTLDPHMASTNMNESSRNGYAPFDRCYEFLELWAFSRKTLCSDPRDKVYAMASLANRDIYMTANTMENRRPLSPDYSKSVSEAYCDMAWFTLLTQADLSVLSMVGYIPDGNKYNLPSWVPDLSYATRMEALNFVLRTRPGLGWLAAGDARWELPPPALLYQRRLSVKAIFVSKIRVIDHAEPSMKDGEPFKFDYKQALEFAENLPSSYYYGGQTQFEVLWRTVIADMAGGDSPAPSRYATEFEKCYLQALREASDDFGVRNAKDFDFLLSLSAMWDLGRLKDDDLSASMEYMHINTNATVEFRNRLMSTMANRRLFIAESGHAGCGDTNLCIGDWVVVLAGSNIPFILRNEGGDGMYRVIGEAYVHGIMYGEAAAKHDVQWKPITLE
jgi:hypothetical protein